MDVRSTFTAESNAGMRPIRGVLYAALFGLAAWGGILALAWTARAALA